MNSQTDTLNYSNIYNPGAYVMDPQHTVLHGHFYGHLIPGTMAMSHGLYQMVCILYRYRREKKVGLAWFPPPGVTNRFIVPAELLYLLILMVVWHLSGTENWPGVLRKL